MISTANQLLLKMNWRHYDALIIKKLKSRSRKAANQLTKESKPELNSLLINPILVNLDEISTTKMDRKISRGCRTPVSFATETFRAQTTNDVIIATLPRKALRRAKFPHATYESLWRQNHQYWTCQVVQGTAGFFLKIATRAGSLRRKFEAASQKNL